MENNNNFGFDVNGGMPPMNGGMPPMAGGMPPMAGGIPPMNGGMPPMDNGMGMQGGMNIPPMPNDVGNGNGLPETSQEVTLEMIQVVFGKELIEEKIKTGANTKWLRTIVEKEQRSKTVTDANNNIKEVKPSYKALGFVLEVAGEEVDYSKEQTINFMRDKCFLEGIGGNDNYGLRVSVKYRKPSSKKKNQFVNGYTVSKKLYQFTAKGDVRLYQTSEDPSKNKLLCIKHIKKDANGEDIILDTKPGKNGVNRIIYDYEIMHPDYVKYLPVKASTNNSNKIGEVDPELSYLQLLQGTPTADDIISRYKEIMAQKAE